MASGAIGGTNKVKEMSPLCLVELERSGDAFEDVF
jgi:hypothetical protein